MQVEYELNRAEYGHRVYLIFYFILCIILMYVLLSFNVRHTYELPLSAPGTLVSDRWEFNFVREWLFWLYFWVLLSGPWMRLRKTRAGVGVHLTLLILLVLWGGLNLVFDIFHLSRANLAPNHPNFDISTLARDSRWCCVYGGQPGTDKICALNALMTPCPGVGIALLRPNPVFVTRVVINCLFIAFLLYDIVVTWSGYLPLLNRYLATAKNE